MNICASIGNTPLLKITPHIYGKFETLNPSGSIKDRMACYILDRAEERGQLKKGDTIIEATSGNTGIAFSMLAAQRGYNMIVVMPCNMSEERKLMIRAFGAEIVEVKAGDFAGAAQKRDELVHKYQAFNPNQFANPDNIECHKNTTGKEILHQVEAISKDITISAFVAGTGTGGTLMGVGHALKEKFPNVQIIAVEPSESAVMSGGKAGLHGIQGIGDGFIPDLVDMNFIDEVITVSTEEANKRAQKITQELGALVGVSAGANVVASEKFEENFHPKGIIITILCDRGERYLSMLANTK